MKTQITKHLTAEAKKRNLDVEAVLVEALNYNFRKDGPGHWSAYRKDGSTFSVLKRNGSRTMVQGIGADSVRGLCEYFVRSL